LNPKRRRLAYTFYPELIDSLSEMQAIGSRGDLDAAKLFERYTAILADQAYNRVIDIPQVRRYIRHRRRNDPKRGKKGEWRFKLSSPPQLKAILFDKNYMSRTPFAYGDPPPGKKVGSPKTDKESLNYFVKTHDCAFSKALLEWRKNEKRHSTYALVALEQMNSFAGYLHGWFRPTGTVTGRLSSNAINLQNVPQVARRIYVSRFGDEGCIVGLDYSQIEVRVAACLSNDPLLLEVYARGEDVHTATMCRMFGYTSEQAAVMEKEDPAKFKRLRTIAKRVVFGVIYGIGPDGIVRTCRGEGITVTEDEAAQYIDKFFEVYAGLADWIADTVNYLEEHGRVVSPFGRVRHLPEIWSDTSTDEGRKRRSRARRQGPNAIIQGTASDFTTTAIILIRREMKKRKLRSKLMLTVHDSIMFDCIRSEVNEVVTLAKHIMENLPELAASVWGEDFDWSWIQCPIVAEPEIGLNWRDQVKYDPSGENKKAFRSVDEALKAAKELQDKEDEVMVRTLAEMKHAA
jgi:DNA polymerase-1